MNSFKNSILSYSQLIRNIILKFPLSRFIFLKFENLVYNHIFLKNNKQKIIQEKISLYHVSNDNLLNQITKYFENYSFKNKTILEIGPGNTLLMAIIFLLKGAKRVYLIDRFKQIYDDSFNFLIFYSYIKKYHNDYQNLSMDNYLSLKKKIYYYGNISFEKFNKIAPESVDLIFSNAVLEHVYDLELTMSNISLLLKKDGLTFHQVDLRDHFHIRDKCYLDFLKYPKRYWQLIGGTNRIRYSEYIKLLKKYKFKIIELKVKKLGPYSRIKELRHTFYDDFKTYDIDLLSIYSLNFLVKKE